MNAPIPAPPPDQPAAAPAAQPPSQLFLDFWSGIGQNNPVFVQMLGLCPSLAVSNSVTNGLAMGVATVFVLVCSSFLISAVRNYIANEVRLCSYILIIATFVTVADMVLAAGFPEVSKALGPFIPLIVVNCIILGRAEAFAGKVGPARAVADAIGMGLGFMLALLIVSAFRELLGSGSILGFNILGPRYEPWVFMVMPPGGFLTLGLIFLYMGWRMERDAQRAKGEKA